MGNVDNSGLKVNMFDVPLEVQYVRLVPVACHHGCTLRFELLGCEVNGECWGRVGPGRGGWPSLPRFSELSWGGAHEAGHPATRSCPVSLSATHGILVGREKDAASVFTVFSRF